MGIKILTKYGFKTLSFTNFIEELRELYLNGVIDRNVMTLSETFYNAGITRVEKEGVGVLYEYVA